MIDTMKTKLTYLCTIATVIVFGIVFSQIDSNSKNNRYIQHEEEALPETPMPETGFASHLPIITVDTDTDRMIWYNSNGVYDDQNQPVRNMTAEEAESKREVGCRVQVFSEKGVWHSLEDTPQVNAGGSIRIRGNSSKNFDKKSYLLKFRKENGEETRESLAGMTKASEWVLNGPILDRTLMRNYLCYNVAGQVMNYVPDVRYCELFLNGEYKGVYLVVEAVTRDEGRLELTKADKNQAVTSWIIRMDREGKGDTPVENFAYYTFQMGVSGVDLRYPGKDTLTPEQFRYVQEDLSEIERAIHSADRSDPVKGYQAYLDVTEFARYFVLNEFFGNVDAGRFSTYYYKDVRGKVAPVVWDFNNGCDNYIDYIYDDSGFNLTQSPWFGQLMKDKKFVNEILHQYDKLRKTVLSDQYLMEFIDETSAYLQDAAERNYEVYGYLFDLSQIDTVNYLEPVERNYTSYEESVKQLKEWLVKRGGWLDRHMDSLLQYCQDSKVVTEIVE